MTPLDPTNQPVDLTPGLDLQPPIPNPQSQSPFWNYGDLFLFVLLLLASLTATLFVGAILVRLPGLNTAWKLILPQLILYVLVLSALAAILRLRYDRPFWPSLDWRAISPTVILGAFLAGPVLAIGLGLLGAALRTPEIDLPFQQMRSSPTTTAILGVIVVILGPVCEELVFRGFLMPLLVRSLGVAVGIIATGILFGCMHGYEYEWSWRHILLISAAGSVFGWGKYTTKSTMTAAFMHATFNLTQFVAFLAQAHSA
jgi:membrane protease YdiL (CAAX protease family)